MTTLDLKQPEIDLANANTELAPLSAIERIQWANQQFGDTLSALTSGGVQSAILPRLIGAAGLQTPVVLINTGNLFPESVDYAEANARLNNLPFYVASSRWGEITDDEARQKKEEDSNL